MAEISALAIKRVVAWELAKKMSDDLDKFYDLWGKPILLGEWGYQIFQDPGLK